MKMSIYSGVSFFMFIFFPLLAETDMGKGIANNHLLNIVKLINMRDNSIAFLFENKSKEDFSSTEFGINLNFSYLSFSNGKNFPMAVFEKPNLEIKFPAGRYVWERNIDIMLKRFVHEPAGEVAALGWLLSSARRPVTLKEQIFIWKPSGKDQETDFRSQYDTKDALNFKIAKLLDDKCLSFAFIVSNNTSKTATLPGFYSSSNRLKVKFPDGKTFVYQPSAAAKDLTLSSGKSEFVKFDLED